MSSVIGREAELAAASAVCEGAAAGRGSALIVVGEPGIGKTALLAAVQEASAGWRHLRVTGVEVESAVAFATLQGLLWPLRDDLAELESSQARLLRGVLNLGPVEGATTFAVGAATLALLSVSSREKPLMITVDDAHWADVASQEVLCFVGRRLSSERIALLAGVRDRENCLLSEERSFQHLTLRGLPADEARTLLERSSPDQLDLAVVGKLLDVCAGNPLGLIELPLVLSEPQRRGEEPLPEQLEAGPLVQSAFAARAARLSAGDMRALLLLAAGGDADPSLLLRVGVPPETIDSIKASGLVDERAGALGFRHPLMQAAVYGAAPISDRREAHRVLAASVEGARCAWHLAAAAAGPDEAVARSLEAVASDARIAGGLAAEAQALERAGELTPDREERARRLLAASRAWRRAGRVDHAMTIVERTLSLTGAVRTRAEVQLERGAAFIREGHPDAALGLLLPEADRAALTEPKLASQLLVKAALAAHTRADTAGAIAYAERALSLAGTDGDRAELEAVNALVEVRTAAGTPPDRQDFELVSRAAELLEQAELRAGSEEVHWISYCLGLQERDEQARMLSDGSLAEARASGDVWNLCYALYARAATEQLTGRIDVARTYASEGVALADQIGETWRLSEAYGVLSDIEAARGNFDGTLRAAKIKLELWNRDLSREFYYTVPLGFACIACGRFAEAIEYLTTASEYIHAGAARAWYHLVPLELAEAYVAVGRKKEAELLVRELVPEIDRCPLIRPKAKLARVHALLTPDAQVDSSFAVALALVDEMPQQLERARVELGWGERLRRAKRSADAAAHLERALARFEALGAVGWAERTRVELEAASGKARLAQARRTDVLSPQELRIAQHAAAGMRDREIAAVLYLSPRTVEFHLQQAYRKLDVSNRTQLAAVLAGDGVRPIAPASEPVPKVQ